MTDPTETRRFRDEWENLRPVNRDYVLDRVVNLEAYVLKREKAHRADVRFLALCLLAVTAIAVASVVWLAAQTPT